MPEMPADNDNSPNRDPIASRFQAALAAHRAGRLTEAEAAYRQVLSIEAEQADALHMLGILCQQQGDPAQAEILIQRALALRHDAIFLANLGNLYQETGRQQQAEKAYRDALATKPDFAQAWVQLGLLYHQAGRSDDAAVALLRALELNPRHAQAYHILGMLRLEQGNLSEAEAACRAALELNPQSAQTLYNLGNVLRLAGRRDDAEAAYRNALHLMPDSVDANNNLGLLLHEAGRLTEAEAAYQRALQIDPGYAFTYNNLGNLLKDSRRADPAEQAYRRALSLRPDYADAQYNLGTLLLALGRYLEAWPNHEFHYDARHKQTAHRISHPVFPEWRGESLAGKSLLIWPEHGFGDYIQFVRYVPLLKQRGATRITLACAAPLRALLETVGGVDAVLTDLNAVGPHDYWAFPMSLPMHFQTTLANVPAAQPYLRALPDRVQRWRPRLPEGGPRVGLVWKGNAIHSNDTNRSLPGLTTLAPLWKVPGLHFVSLQKWRGEHEARQSPASLPLLELGVDIADFADSAAIVSQLDLVICVDTAIAHVAGALGKPCWVLLPALGTDWRWLMNRTDSPWYPQGMRLFRQSVPGDWNGTVDAVALALDEWSRGQTVTRPAAERIAAFAATAMQSGMSAHRAGDLEAAEKAYRQALSVDPSHADALHMLGILHRETARPDEAESLLRQALAIREDALFLTNLGNLLAESGRDDEAATCYRRALTVAPKHAGAHYNFALLLQKRGNFPEAEAAYRHALVANPDFAEAYDNLGLLLHEENRLPEAEAAYRRALALRPALVEACLNLGNLLADTWRLEEAEAVTRRALAVRPDFPEARENLGLQLLAQGRYLEAWPYQESRNDPRLNKVDKRPAPPTFAQWQGQSLAGKTLLIWPEQGYGDYIHFARYMSLLKQRGVARLTLACGSPLKPLLETAAGVDEVIADVAQLSLYDYWCYPMSLPLHFDTTLDTIPAALPYLHALPERVAYWRTRLPTDGIRIGLAWKGNPLHRNDRNRSLPDLDVLALLWKIPNISFVSLQTGPAEQEALASAAMRPIAALGEAVNDFADTAAIIAQLDLVICVDTAIAHLAGALGKPCWVLLTAFRPDWRWLLDRSDSPWYPGIMRLFRQKQRGEWNQTITEVVAELKHWRASLPP